VLLHGDDGGGDGDADALARYVCVLWLQSSTHRRVCVHMNLDAICTHNRSGSQCAIILTQERNNVLM